LLLGRYWGEVEGRRVKHAPREASLFSPHYFHLTIFSPPHDFLPHDFLSRFSPPQLFRKFKFSSPCDADLYSDYQKSVPIKLASLLNLIAIGCCFDSLSRIYSGLQKLLYRSRLLQPAIDRKIINECKVICHEAAWQTSQSWGGESGEGRKSVEEVAERAICTPTTATCALHTTGNYEFCHFG